MKKKLKEETEKLKKMAPELTQEQDCEGAKVVRYHGSLNCPLLFLIVHTYHLLSVTVHTYPLLSLTVYNGILVYTDIL